MDRAGLYGLSIPLSSQQTPFPKTAFDVGQAAGCFANNSVGEEVSPYARIPED